MNPISLAAVTVFCFVAGCTSGPAPKTGFLGDYTRMLPVGSSDSLLEQRPDPEFDVRKYHAIMIDSTIVRVDSLDDNEKKQLSDVFRQALIERLNGALPVVTEPGPGVLRVRTAIVDARKANVGVNVLTSLLLMPVTRGGMAAEAEVVDSGNGARIAALAWSRSGAKLAEVGLSYTGLGHARSGLRGFAKRLAELFVAPEVSQAQSAAISEEGATNER